MAPADLLQVAREQGLAGALFSALEAAPPAWAAELLPALADTRRALLVRTLAQLGLARRALQLLEREGIRALPLKGAVLAETVYGVEADRPMSDVDVLALERFADAARALAAAGFHEVVRGDHAWAFRDPEGHGIVELHRSVVSAPGLFPLDAEGLWARRRAGRGQLGVLPSAEDLLLQLALHAAFQHGLVLSLVQWLDFRLLLEQEAIDTPRLLALADAARAGAPLACALAVAREVAAAPVPDALVAALLPPARRYVARAAREPLSFVAPVEPRVARVRFDLLAGRRLELVWRTLVLPETPGGSVGIGARLAAGVGRGLRLARRVTSDEVAFERANAAAPPDARPQAAPAPGVSARAVSEATPAAGEVGFGEALLRDCLSAFPHVRLTVTGTCMEPALGHGERVHLVSARELRPRIGDVVLARQSEGLRLHRLVFGPPLALFGSAWRTKADRGLLLDPPLRREDVLASVVRVEGRPKARPRRTLLALASLARGVASRLAGHGRPAETAA